MAGSLAEAQAQITSLQPGVLRTTAGQLRGLSTAVTGAGSTLAGSARDVGAQRGAPYAAYEERLAPTADWLTRLSGPTTALATALEGGAAAAERAQMVLAQQLQMLSQARAASPAQAAALEAQALAALNAAIADVTGAYAGILPPPPGAAPVVAGGTGGAGPTGAPGAAAAGAGVAGGVGGSAAAANALGLRPGAAELAGGTGKAGSGVGLGPEAGPFAGFIQDPTTGTLVDPATGREVDAGGRFLDPVTGLPFGDPAQFTSRLEGVVGGGNVPAAIGVPGAGGLAPAPTAGVAGTGAGGGGFAGGGAAFLPPGAVGAGAIGVGAGRGAGVRGGGTGRFAALYGGTLPPSLSASNPANGQLEQIAATNLENRAAVAQRYSAIASGQAGTGQTGMGFLPPPVGGLGGGAPGGAARRGGSRGVRESPGVWGAVPGTGRGTDRRRRSAQSADVEDADVWTGGGGAGSALLDGR
jgi:hypothetical protein